ncbi:Uncharacterized protein HZ326_20261 [Fusarium oxysporum f. sp. albedinis]|nr:Uncharacterized protein HZ326_20261 [Fusarium oxysporum f. sp. albedinis]
MHMCIVSDVPREICETSFLYVHEVICKALLNCEFVSGYCKWAGLAFLLRLMSLCLLVFTSEWHWLSYPSRLCWRSQCSEDGMSLS